MALDLDETLGAWGLGSLAFKMFLKFGDGIPPPVDMFVDGYLAKGGARPWLKELLQTLEWWKRTSRIDEVCIFTAASNHEGWVSYLESCIEAYAGTPGLFGRCFTRESSELIPSDSGIRTLKDLSVLSPNPEHVVLLDDKPDYALNGYVIGVPEYSQDVCVNQLAEMMVACLPEFEEDIHLIFAADRESHPPNDLDFSADDALRNAVQVLATIFPETTGPQAESSEGSVLTECRLEDAWANSSIECF